tara:strand:+ start:344 stop:2311 length:1968 start_codon:yes stop_codon:yes gene_type:complete
MDNQTIIELREQDRNATNYEIASWENTLSTDIKLYNNDSLELKGVFIDSVAQNSGRVVVQPDDPTAPIGSDAREKATIGISFCQYFHDWGTSTAGATELDDRNYVPVAQKYTSGRDYVLCDKIGLGGATITEVSEILLFNQVPPSGLSGGGEIAENYEDPVRFFYKYLNQAGKLTKMSFDLDQTLLKTCGFSGVGQTGTEGAFKLNQSILDSKKGIIKGGTISFPFLAIKNGISATETIAPDDTTIAPFMNQRGKKVLENLNGAQFMQLEFIKLTGTTTEDVQNTDGELFQPRIIELNFKIDARDYAPDELAKILSKNFTETAPELYIEDENALADNPLLTTTRSLQVLGDAVVDNTHLPEGLQPVPAGNANTPPFFCRDDGQAIVNYVADCQNYVVGTSQFAIEFNQNVGAEGIFQLTQMHIPLYDHSGNTLVIAKDIGTTAGAGGKRVKFLANKNGGVLLTDVRPATLWRDQMKFDLSKLLTTFKLEPKQSFGGLTNIRTCSFSAVDGVNSTGALKSIDDTLNKDTTFDKVVPYTATGSPIKTPYLTEINASESLDGDSALDNGYYLIELTSNFYTNKISGEDQKRNIMGIVSRFYQQDSFTSSIDGEGTFTYVHKGEPITISRIGCRILNAQHQLATNLKDNNTIFLQLNRQ